MDLGCFDEVLYAFSDLFFLLKILLFPSFFIPYTKPYTMALTSIIINFYDTSIEDIKITVHSRDML